MDKDSKNIDDYKSPYEKFMESPLPPIIKRDEWGARPPKKPPIPLKNEPCGALKIAFNYNNGVKECKDKTECMTRMREMQSLHMDKLGFDDIGLNFVIGGDKNIYEGRGWYAQSAPEMNMPSYQGRKFDFGWLGDYQDSDTIPPELSRIAYKLIQEGVALKRINPDYEVCGFTGKSVLDPDRGEIPEFTLGL